MKKQLLAIVLALCAMTSVAFGATSEQQNTADALNALDLFLGTDKGYELDNQLQRSDGIALLVRLLGKESDAQSGKYAHPFTDVAAWLDPYVAYAYTTGITSGVSEESYGSSAAMSRAQFFTMVLRALGYTDGGESADFSWDAPFALAKSVGLTDSDSTAETFTRGDAVVTFWNALSAAVKGAGDTLSETLVGAGVFTADELAAAAEIQKNGKPADKYAYADAVYINPRTGNPMTAKQMILELTAFGYFDKAVYTQYDQQNVTKIQRTNDPLRMIDTRREIYNSPEVPSEERTVYFDCSSFVWSNFYEAFGESFSNSADRFVPKTALMCNKGSAALAAGKIGPDQTVAYYRTVSAQERGVPAIGEQIIREMKDILIPGDVIVYGSSSTPGVYDGGHTLLYLDGGYTVEAVGGDYKYLTGVDTLEADGGVKLRVADEYLFNLDSASCVYNRSNIAQIAILRPLNDPELQLTERAVARLANNYLSVTKLGKTPGQTVENGESVTFTIVLDNDSVSGKNTNATVTVSDPLPTNVTYVSATNGGRLENGVVKFENVSVGAGETVALSYTVTVNASEGEIVSGTGDVNGISFTYHAIEIGAGMSTAQYNALAEKIAAGKSADVSALSWVNTLYRETVGKDLGVTSEAELFDAFFSDSSVSGLYKVDHKAHKVVDALVENYSAGFLVLNETQEEQQARMRNLTGGNLRLGDLLVYESRGTYTYYVFRGEEMTKITDAAVSSAPVNKTLVNAFAQDRFVVLRPSKI